jgi:hypothetical protein
MGLYTWFNTIQAQISMAENDAARLRSKYGQGAEEWLRDALQSAEGDREKRNQLRRLQRCLRALR